MRHVLLSQMPHHHPSLVSLAAPGKPVKPLGIPVPYGAETRRGVLSSVLSSVLCSPGVAPLDLRVLTCKSVSQGCRSLSLHLTRRKAKTCRLWSSSARSPGLEFLLLRAQSPRQLGLPESWWDWSVSSTPSSLPSSERPVEGVSKGGESGVRYSIFYYHPKVPGETSSFQFSPCTGLK